MKFRFSKMGVRYIVTVAAVVGLAVGLFLAYVGGWSRQRADVISSATPFEGLALEASGVTNVPGADGVLIVDNGRHGQVFWMKLDGAGKQVGPIKAIQLGTAIEDVEGITTDGTYFYVVSSQSRPKAIASAGLVRFKFDTQQQTVSDVTAVNGLKQYLVENVAELRQEGNRKSKDGGLNIEGLAWDVRQNRLLIGLRSPIVDEQALVVPIKLRDPRGSFSTGNFEVQKTVRLALGGLGIRGFEYDARAKLFRVISGAAENQTMTDFGLWEWRAEEAQSAAKEIQKFDKRLKPEGVARATVGTKSFTIVVFDSSGYTTLNNATIANE